MTDLWNTLVNQYLAKIVSPDWATLVALIPLALAGVVVLYVGWMVVRFATAGPRTSGGPVTPRSPAGVHMPGPSLSPLYLAGAATVLFLGLAAMNADKSVLVVGVPLRDIGPWIFALGVILTIGAGLYWGREVMRESARPEGRGVVAGSWEGKAPPAGVHVPGPSFRPLLIAVAATVLLLGLGLATNAAIVKQYGSVGAWVLAAGFIMIITVGLQWLRDAVIEYRLAVRADHTGHLDNPPAPHFPWLTLGFFAVLLIGAVVLGSGAFPPGSGAASGTAAASAAPGGGGAAASPAAGGGGAASTAPAASTGAGGGGTPSGPVIKLAAQNIAYDQTELTAPANTAFTISFDNQDSGIPHNVAIHKDSPTGEVVFTGEIITGPAQKDYAVPALPAGTYAFVCTVHPNMTGTLTVK